LDLFSGPEFLDGPDPADLTGDPAVSERNFDTDYTTVLASNFHVFASVPIVIGPLDSGQHFLYTK
jgi:hypothetical protein